MRRHSLNGKDSDGALAWDEELYPLLRNLYGPEARSRWQRQQGLREKIWSTSLELADGATALEAYFKLSTDGVSFHQLQSLRRNAAPLLSSPVQVGQLEEPLRSLLLQAAPGQVQLPIALADDCHVLVRVDHREAAQWGEEVERLLVMQLYQEWLMPVIEPLLAQPPGAGTEIQISLPSESE